MARSRHIEALDKVKSALTKALFKPSVTGAGSRGADDRSKILKQNYG